MKLSRFNFRRQDGAGICHLLVLVLVVLVLLQVAACSKKEESPAVLERRGWVSDYAAVLQPEESKRFETLLAAYEKETCHQLYVVIIPSLAGESIVDFSKRIATDWQIGQPGFGNGFLVSIAMEEGTVRIETGSAFEWFIQNGTADRILKEVMFPLFRQDRFVEGLQQGLQEIMEAGRLKPIPENHKPDVCRQ